MRVKKPFCGRSGSCARDMAIRIATNHPLARGFHKLGSAAGVGLHKRHNKWEAHYWVSRPSARGMQQYVGSYTSIEEAAAARDRHMLIAGCAEHKLEYSVLLYDLEQLRSMPKEDALHRLKKDRLFGINRAVRASWHH